MTDWANCPAVESVPGKVSGHWVFKDTRLQVYSLFENLAAGATIYDFIEWFGGVEESELQAVLEYVAQDLRAGVPPAHPVIDWGKCPGIESVPERVSGNWVFTGTRLPVYALFENLGGGAAIYDFMEWFDVEEESELQPVLEYVAQDLRARVPNAHPVR